MERSASDPAPTSFQGVLCLAGPPGSGKTTVGRLLSRRLGIPFSDLDEMIESTAGMSIEEIFISKGENGFRDLELQALRGALGEAPSVLAVGGGCLLSPEAMSLVLEQSVVVSLHADDPVLAERCGRGSRPLAGSGDELRSLLRSRREHYMSLPNRIDTSHMTPREAAEQVLAVMAVLGVIP